MRILIPVDGSELSNDTLKWAAKTFPHHTCRYLLLNIIPIGIGIDSAYQKDLSDKILENAKDVLTSADCEVVSVDHAIGESGHEICEYASDKEVDQVLIGSHGRTGLAKLLLGSVSSYVLEHCRKPVLVYRNLVKATASAGGVTPNKML